VRLAKVPKYSVAELERRAEQLLRDAWGWPPSIPVDIESLVEREPGVLLDILLGLQKLCGVVGIARYEQETDTMRILIDADVADHPAGSFYRFTVAEEFAHVLLHRDIMAQVQSLEDLLALHAWRGYHEIDRNAKRLAAALLMPTITVSREARAVYPQLVKAVGFGDPAAVEAHLAERLARLHAVSAAAMRNRLKEWPLRITQKMEGAMRERLMSLE